MMPNFSGESDLTDARMRGSMGGHPPTHPQDRLRPYSGRYNDAGPGLGAAWQGESGIQDSRTLTWDRNPRPDRNDPKYFPVSSLPRNQQQQRSAAFMQQQQQQQQQPLPEEAWYGGGSGPPPPGAGAGPPPPGQHHPQMQQQQQQRDYGMYGDKNDTYSTGSRISMPPPMHAMNSYKPPPPVVTDQPRQMKDQHQQPLPPTQQQQQQQQQQHYTKPMYNGFPGGGGGGRSAMLGGREQRGPAKGPPPPGLLNGGDPKLFSPGYNVDSYSQGNSFQMLNFTHRIKDIFFPS